MKQYLTKELQEGKLSSIIVHYKDCEDIRYDIECIDGSYRATGWYKVKEADRRTCKTYEALKLDSSYVFVAPRCIRHFCLSTDAIESNRAWDDATLVTLPIAIDLEVNTGIFLYTLLDYDNGGLFEPVFLEQSLEAWEENFDDEDQYNAIQALGKWFNCEVQLKHENCTRLPDYVSDGQVKELQKGLKETLIFGDEEGANSIAQILKANINHCHIYITEPDNQIIDLTGFTDETRKQGLYLDLDYEPTNSQAFILDLRKYTLEASLYTGLDVNNFLIIGLQKQIERTAKERSQTNYEAWRSFALCLLDADLGFYTTALEIEWLNIISRGQFLGMINAQWGRLMMTYNDFYDNTQVLIDLISKHRRWVNSVHTLEETMYPFRGLDRGSEKALEIYKRGQSNLGWGDITFLLQVDPPRKIEDVMLEPYLKYIKVVVSHVVDTERGSVVIKAYAVSPLEFNPDLEHTSPLPCGWDLQLESSEPSEAQINEIKEHLNTAYNYLKSYEG